MDQAQTSNNGQAQVEKHLIIELLLVLCNQQPLQTALVSRSEVGPQETSRSRGHFAKQKLKHGRYQSRSCFSFHEFTHSRDCTSTRGPLSFFGPAHRKTSKAYRRMRFLPKSINDMKHHGRSISCRVGLYCVFEIFCALHLYVPAETFARSINVHYDKTLSAQ